MKFAQYKRLTLVLFLPLLIAGYFTAKYLSPYDRSIMIFCQPSLFSIVDSCEEVFDDQYYSFKKRREGNNYFSINGYFREDDSLRTTPFASQREFNEVKFLSVTPFFGTTKEIFEVINKIPGRTGSIYFGGTKNSQSKFLPDNQAHLSCNTFEWLKETGKYRAICGGEGWTTNVEFAASQKTVDQINNLKNALDLTIRQTQKDFNTYRVVMYPIFLYIYFLLSLLIFAIYKGYKFVKGNDNV